MKKDDEYEKNFRAYMKGDIEEYFEVRYIKKEYLLFILMCVPLGMVCMHALLSDIDTSSLNWWGLLIIGILFFAIPTIKYFYKSRERIVYDHGQITHYLGSRVKASGSIYEVDRVHTYLYQTGEAGNSLTGLIMFNSGDKIFFIRKSMDCGYKLEALIIKKDLWIDRAAEAINELREEYGEDKDLDELEKLLKGYDESEDKT